MIRTQLKALASVRHLAWLALAVSAVAWMGASVPYAWQRFGTVCTADCLPLALTPAALTELAALGLTPGVYAAGLIWVDAILFLFFAATSLITLLHRAEHAMGWLLSVALLVLGVGVTQTGSSLAPVYPGAFGILMLLGGLSFVSVFFLFPDGRFVPSWNRYFGALQLVFVAAYAGRSLFPREPLGEVASSVGLLISVVCMGAAVFGQVLRYRRADSEQARAQMLWALGGVVALVAASLAWGALFELPYARGEAGPSVLVTLVALPAVYLLTAAFPFAVSYSLFQHQLWKARSGLSPAVVYATLSMAIVGIYVVLVGVLSAVFRPEDAGVVSLLVTGVIALAVNPLRAWLQRVVNRRLFGQRDDPLDLLSKLGDAEGPPRAVLQHYVATIARELKLPYVAVFAADRDKPAASDGAPAGVKAELPLVHHGAQLGRLVVSAREGEPAVASADMEVLVGLSTQVAAVLRSIELTENLMRSRQALVETRAEEQRRLRRDLHDGLGPVLAAQGLKLSLARQVLERAPERTAELLDELVALNKETVTEVRRLVHDLRPPALDELGLAEAIRRHGGRVLNGTELSVVTQPSALPSLPAAVEVAVFRIAIEAVTNVARHGAAGSCVVMVEVGEDVVLRVSDDGRGFDVEQVSSGVGLRSMQERADELGGALLVQSDASGTVITVRIGLEEAN